VCRSQGRFRGPRDFPGGSGVQTNDDRSSKRSSEVEGAPSAAFVRRGAIRILVAASLLATLACARPVAPPPQAPPIEGYVVGAPDNLRILVLPEPAIQRDVRVRPDGMISLDLVGDIQAGGLTPTQIAEAIRERITRFKRDAAVSVIVLDSPSQYVTIFGEVARPGTFSLAAETRVSEALGQVGGTRAFASHNKIRLVRTDGTTTKVLRIRLRDIEKGDLTTNYVVEEGDLIVVPPTVLARIGYAMQMLLFPLQPLISGATTAGAIAAGAGSTQ
jgi:polysaccharide export outer membrane protein